jgi:hypothetical protein
MLAYHFERNVIPVYNWFKLKAAAKHHRFTARPFTSASEGLLSPNNGKGMKIKVSVFCVKGPVRQIGSRGSRAVAASTSFCEQ